MEIENTVLDGGGTAFVKLGNWKHKSYLISIHTMEISTQPKWIPFCGTRANVNRSYSPFEFPVYIQDFKQSNWIKLLRLQLPTEALHPAP